MKLIGEIYKEKILTRKDLVNRELPYNYYESQIIKDLFGYKLVCGKHQVECATEEEARYLKIFLDIGLTEIKIPRDHKFLCEILPELETCKIGIDEIMNDFMKGILNRRARERLKHEVYMEFAKY